IKNIDTELIRGWRAHRMEQRWFYVLSGSFAVDLIQIDNWENASPELPIERRILKAEEQQVLHVPAGYGTACQAVEPESGLLVFADYGIENAKNDDYTWSIDYFKHRSEQKKYYFCANLNILWKDFCLSKFNEIKKSMSKR